MIDDLQHDLSFFADLGTEPPSFVRFNDGQICQLYRYGTKIDLIVMDDGTILEKYQNKEHQRKDFKSLLASENFANLGRWAGAQAAYLRPSLIKNTIDVHGADQTGQIMKTHEFDDVIHQSKLEHNSVAIFLLDGPAGIGKTNIIRSIAFERANSYRSHQRKLILHVESRGRVLQNLLDLMAFSLQTIRVGVTYDQIPPLVRRGLVVIAIDGFDELGDPNGYELAWAQVNETVRSIRGDGQIILAGRETFIGIDRIKNAIPALRDSLDKINSYTVLPISPSYARKWLQGREWSEETLEQENVKPIFESGSYALRPFFLSELAKDGVHEQVKSGEIEDLMWFLVQNMLERESGKFGRDVESLMDKAQRINFIEKYLCEVARDLAENQTDAISSETLSWLAEAAADQIVSRSLVGILKNRASVMAFLVEDDRPNHRRFSHSQLKNHFLSRETFFAISEGDLPKYIRRNILGAEFLESFIEVAGHQNIDNVKKFMSQCIRLINEIGHQDRSRQNLAALLVALSSISIDGEIGLIDTVYIDELVVFETASAIRFSNCSVAQWDIRGADISKYEFVEECYVASVIADSSTSLPIDFPLPKQLIYGGASVKGNQEIKKVIVDLQGNAWNDWVRDFFKRNSHLREAVESHPLSKILNRLARYKPFWLKEGEDGRASQILDDEAWPSLLQMLTKYNLITITADVPSSGPGAKFYHLRKKEKILDKSTKDEDVVGFVKEHQEAIINDILKKIELK